MTSQQEIERVIRDARIEGAKLKLRMMLMVENAAQAMRGRSSGTMRKPGRFEETLQPFGV